MVIAAQREQVVRRGGTPAGGIAVIERLTVIEIAPTRRDAAPGEAARAVPQAHQPGHGGAGGIGVGPQLRECAGAGVGEGPHPVGVRGELPGQVRVDRPVTHQLGRVLGDAEQRGRRHDDLRSAVRG